MTTTARYRQASVGGCVEASVETLPHPVLSQMDRLRDAFGGAAAN